MAEKRREGQGQDGQGRTGRNRLDPRRQCSYTTMDFPSFRLSVYPSSIPHPSFPFHHPSPSPPHPPHPPHARSGTHLRRPSRSSMPIPEQGRTGQNGTEQDRTGQTERSKRMLPNRTHSPRTELMPLDRTHLHWAEVGSRGSLIASHGPLIFDFDLRSAAFDRGRGRGRGRCRGR